MRAGSLMPRIFSNGCDRVEAPSRSVHRYGEQPRRPRTAWWLENREHQTLFAIELERAIEILALLPGAGTPYTHSEVPDLRRLYVRKLGCHLYLHLRLRRGHRSSPVGRSPRARADVLIVRRLSVCPPNVRASAAAAQDGTGRRRLQTVLGNLMATYK